MARCTIEIRDAVPVLHSQSSSSPSQSVSQSYCVLTKVISLMVGDLAKAPRELNGYGLIEEGKKPLR